MLEVWLTLVQFKITAGLRMGGIAFEAGEIELGITHLLDNSPRWKLKLKLSLVKCQGRNRVELGSSKWKIINLLTICTSRTLKIHTSWVLKSQPSGMVEV